MRPPGPLACSYNVTSIPFFASSDAQVQPATAIKQKQREHLIIM